MKDVKTIECDDSLIKRTGTYFDSPSEHEKKLMVGDIAYLSCGDVTVLAKVQRIEGDGVVGTIMGFENADIESAGGADLDDDIRFDCKKVQDWHRP